MSTNPPYAAPAAACAAELLAALATRGVALSLTELAREVDRSKSLAYRVMRELEKSELVERQANGRYKLGIVALLLGGAYVSNPLFTGSTDRALRKLADETGDSAYLGVLDGDAVRIRSGYEGRNSIATASLVGQSIPANCSAMGKVLLARRTDREVIKIFRNGLRGFTSQSIVEIDKLREELAGIRLAGYAKEDGETHLGLAGFAFSIDGQELASGPLRTETRTKQRKELTEDNGTEFGAAARALGISMSIESSDAHRADALDALRRATASLERETTLLDIFGTAPKGAAAALR